MRGFRLLLFVLMSAALSACYQVSAPVVEAGVRAPGLADGAYRQDDGTKVALHWDQALGGYRIDSGGVVKVRPLTDLIYLADYQAERRIALLARRSQSGDLVFLVPPQSLEKQMTTQAGLSLRAGPIKILDGDADKLLRYFSSLAASPDLIEAGRLTLIR
jgi:hypothetical protein